MISTCFVWCGLSNMRDHEMFAWMGLDDLDNKHMLRLEGSVRSKYHAQHFHIGQKTGMLFIYIMICPVCGNHQIPRQQSHLQT